MVNIHGAIYTATDCCNDCGDHLGDDLTVNLPYSCRKEVELCTNNKTIASQSKVDHPRMCVFI